jgi:hypothetical protein
MRTEKIKIYKFNELSDEAKEKAIEDYRNQDHYFFGSDNEASLKAFENIFPIKIRDWSYGGNRGDGIKYTLKCDDTIAGLSGQRLATYIWNNYREIYKGKYYSSKMIPTGRDTPPMYNYKFRYSKCTLETGYNLTGYCADSYLLDTIFDFMNKPTDRTFEELMNDCLNEWISQCTKDIEYNNSEECIENNFEDNEYEFYETGEMY